MLNRFFLLVGITTLMACAKDKIPVEEPVKPTKWELIEGDYKVYDTLGTFLYDMSINHLKSQFIDFDSLRFENLDNNFVFGEQQSFYTDLYINFFTFGHHSLLLDNAGNSWKMMEVGNLPYNNFQNDTIKLKFRITNINYYLSDLVPYCDTTKIQIAVKQH